MVRSSIIFFFFFSYSIQPSLSVFFGGYAGSVFLSVTALVLIYFVVILKSVDVIKSMTSSFIVTAWSIYGFLLMISVVNPYSQA